MSYAIFSGGFSRFFLGDWETDQEKTESIAEDFGNDHEFDDEHDGVSPGELQEYFTEFRTDLYDSLKNDLRNKTIWVEDAEGDYYAQSIQPEELGSLMLVASRAFFASIGRTPPPLQLKSQWTKDRAIADLQGEDKHIKPIHHLINADVWVPAEFINLATAELPDREIVVGSLAFLEEALKLTSEGLKNKSALGNLPGNICQEAAQGLASFASVAAFARQKGLPILLDT